MACFDLYSTDDPLIIGKLYDTRFKMGLMGLDDIECLDEAIKIAEASYFTLADNGYELILETVVRNQR